MSIVRRTVVAVFDDPTAGERAIRALEEAGFSLQQISISNPHPGTEAGEHRHEHSGLIENLKRLFTVGLTGTENTPTDVKDDLEGMGLSPDAAQYYEDQYKRGRSVIGVRTEDRVEDAVNVLRSHGGHDFAARPDASQAAAERIRGQVTGSGQAGNIDMNRPPATQQPGPAPAQRPASGQPEMPPMPPMPPQPQQPMAGQPDRPAQPVAEQRGPFSAPSDRADADMRRTDAPINPPPAPETDREQPGRSGHIPDYAYTSDQPRQTEGSTPSSTPGSAPIDEPQKLNPVDEERARRQREQGDEP